MDGRFVSTAERTSSTVTSYGAEPFSGKLSYENSTEVGFYRIDGEIGVLKRRSGVPAGADANWVEIVEAR